LRPHFACYLFLENYEVCTLGFLLAWRGGTAVGSRTSGGDGNFKNCQPFVLAHGISGLCHAIWSSYTIRALIVLRILKWLIDYRKITGLVHVAWQFNFRMFMFL
jgi:hypothetical protein